MLANWLAACGQPVAETTVALLEQSMRTLTQAASVR
jgi:para-aminobenzoate synthetase component 2